LKIPVEHGPNLVPFCDHESALDLHSPRTGYGTGFAIGFSWILFFSPKRGVDQAKGEL
jgi:hypothetical protein